ncbi:hypothetical protein [Halorarius litoreus]|uniref:hypothetical protein n=1 Tax=Halorarius litoreus TaxID=2962676 RepID=UPI0020CCEA0D|nr:hypothetical protein [Halorarius litoreus]
MLRRLRETGPVLLVPLAWTFATAAHLELLATRTVLIGHVVMAALLFAFAALSWQDMQAHPVLRAWLAVIVVGFGVTLVGAYALATGSDPTLTGGTVLGWMLIPALALLYTGQVLPREERAWAYTVGGALSGLGAVVFLFGRPLVALALVGVGQTLGILVAVVKY